MGRTTQNRLALLGCLAAAALTPPPLQAAPAPRTAQEAAEPLEVVELRVLAASPGGLVEVDRGAADGLEVGDRVVLRPRQGGPLEGRVAVVEERTALLELENPNANVPGGTRGSALVPASRFADPEPQPVAPQPEAVDEQPAETEGIRWSNPDEGFEPGMPLLTDVRVAKPEERPTRLTGRLYLALDQIVTSEDGRADAFYRLGNDFSLENPFGYGGELRLDGELTYRRNDLPDQDDEEVTRYRLDRLSYRHGGTRFAPTSWEVGRLLHRGMPEFGFLDGAEWIVRRENGHRYGASMGLLPEPTPTLESGEDFGVSGFYEWNADASERVQAAVGYQHTWHNGASDRDLVVLRAHSLPAKGWQLFGVTLIDVYSSGDDAKGSGVALTQANLTARRAWEGYGFAARYIHQEFPEIDKNDFLAVDPTQLADDHYDRLAMSVYVDVVEELRLDTEFGLWVDEDENGGFGEVGFELFDAFGDGSLAHAEGFLTQGEFTDVFGARLGIGVQDGGGRWDLTYELAHQDNLGFDDNNDDLVQHRVRASRDWLTALGWNLSVYADFVSWDEEQGLLAGFFAQKGF